MHSHLPRYRRGDPSGPSCLSSIATREATDRALDAIRQRIYVDRNHDIPGIAGYSLDGRTIYIDRHMPHGFVDHGRRVYTDRFLILHAAVEKALIRWLGLSCEHAHGIATLAEWAAVRGEGLDLEVYEDFLLQHVKTAEHEQLARIPNTLDLRSYRESCDREVLQRLERLFVPVVRPIRPYRAGRESATPADTSGFLLAS